MLLPKEKGVTVTTATEIEAPGGPVLAAFLAAVTLGGSNFIAVRFSNRELEPFWGAGLRFSLAAALFVIFALALRLRLPRGRSLFIVAAYGLFTFAFSYALLYWALVRVTAGMGTVVLAVVPLVTLLLATLYGMERLGRRALTGSVLSLAGILWMTLGPQEVAVPISGLVALLATAVVMGQGVILGKKISSIHPVMVNAVGIPFGAVVLLIISAIAGESWVLPQQPEVVVSVAYLVLFGSGALFVLILLVVRRWTASATSYAFVLFPVVTMLLEAWLAGEPITMRGVTGAAMVMAGVWLGALSPASRRPKAAPRPSLEPT